MNIHTQISSIGIN